MPDPNDPSTNSNPRPQSGSASRFGDDLRYAAGRAEEELQRLIAYLNDEVVPDVRRQSSDALRKAAEGCGWLAHAGREDGRSPSMNRRWRLESSALLLVLAASGCHKNGHVARAPQAPPPIAAPVRRPPVVASGPDEYPSSSAAASSGTVADLPSYVPRPAIPADNSILSGRLNSGENEVASWYGPPYNHRAGGNGEIYDQNAMTAAHRTLPYGTLVRVTNLRNGRETTVRITDRGPFVRGRQIDLSVAAAKAINVYGPGTEWVRVRVVKPAEAAAQEGRWCVQTGAFQHGKNSNRLRDEMVRSYAGSAKIIEFTGPTGHWVRVTPQTADRNHAFAVMAREHPREADAQAWLVRLD